MKNKPELDGVRGWAVLMVLFWHYLGSDLHLLAISSSFWFIPLKLTWSGVDLFFVLSGYLISSQLLGDRVPIKKFYLKRMRRIMPLYYAMLLAYLVLSHSPLAHVEALSGLFLTPIPWWTYLFFVQNYAMAAGNTWGSEFLGVTWSVALEEQFYFLIPWLFKIIPFRKIPVFCTYGILLSIAFNEFNSEIQNLFPHWEHPGLQSYVLFPWRGQAILFGIFLAWMDLAGNFPKVPAWIFRLLFFVTGVFLLYEARDIYSFGFNYLYTAIFYGSLVAWLLADTTTSIAAFFRQAWLKYLGRISYGIYLFHLPVRAFVGWGLDSDSKMLVVAVSTLVTLLAAHFSYQTYEKRFLLH